MAAGIGSVVVIADELELEGKANSVSFMEGSPERDVRTQVSGNKVTPVFTENFETAIGEFKMTLLNTTVNIDNVKKLKNTAQFKLEFTSNGFQRTMGESTITNKPEFTIGNDGEAEIEIKGSVLV